MERAPFRRRKKILGYFYSKYKGNTKEIRRAKRAGEFFGAVLLEIQRKHKGNPAREARRGILSYFTKIQRKYKGNRAREARREFLR